jgi:hypothetical protein
MSSPRDNIPRRGNRAPTRIAQSGTNLRRKETMSRLRSALLDDRLAQMDLSRDKSGADPRDTGIHLAAGGTFDWSNR